MELNKLVETLQTKPESVSFSDVMAVIERHYRYTPADFSNGNVTNAAGTNEGSCKIFSFANLNKLNEPQTLACFGDYYRKDVLLNPTGTDHANIRNFMQTGWGGIVFNSEALSLL